jgi:hypothetical protein
MSLTLDRDARTSRGRVFLTDAQICERWHCTQMTLWRKRRDGRLRKPIKIGGVGKNITQLEHVEEAERS